MNIYCLFLSKTVEERWSGDSTAISIAVDQQLNLRYGALRGSGWCLNEVFPMVLKEFPSSFLVLQLKKE